ncbi:hypothetical protein [Microbacterium sp.]|uniref:hypothetical protein n=1 Tax=Microbacterium sp. TaxID=51671 RepID=UPI0039E53B3C
MHILTSNPIDPGVFAGIGFGFMILALVIYLGLIGLMLWIGYLIMRTAVKNGVILAMRETGAQITPRPGYGAPPAPPASWRPQGG